MGSAMDQGSVLVVVLVAAAAVAALALLLVLRARSRRLARERTALQDGLRRSQQQVETLAAQVADLGAEVRAARRTAEVEREYVVTTLAEAAEVSQVRLAGDDAVPTRQPTSLPRLLETRVLERLERVETRTPLGRRAVESAVSVVAAAHGARRALRPEHLDRAAAESHVARRRSRRARKQELREAKRLLRAVKAQRPTQGRRQRDQQDQEVA